MVGAITLNGGVKIPLKKFLTVIRRKKGCYFGED